MDDREKLAKLEARLQDGFQRIGEAMNSGVAVDDWQAFWEKLLKEYEAISDELAATPPEQQPMELGRIERAA